MKEKYDALLSRGINSLLCLIKTSMLPAIFLVFYTLPLTGQDFCEGIEAQFTVTLLDGELVFQAVMPVTDPPTDYTWIWTDAYSNSGGGTGTTLSIPASFGTENTFIVKLNANNINLDVTCLHAIAWVTDCQRAGFTYDAEGCLVNFEPDYLTGFIHYWDFGDGTFVNEPTPGHQYTQGDTYNVCHIIQSIGGYGFNWCCDEVTVHCLPGGDGPDFNGMLMGDCCRLKVCFESAIQDPEAEHSWEFGDCHTSTEANPCNYYDNISTYPENMGGTPSVTVKHCVTLGGVTQCTSQTVYLTSPLFPPAIYVGEPNVSTPLTVVSCIDGQPLFPGNLLEGPYMTDPLKPLEVHVAGDLQINKNFTFQHHVSFCMNPCAGMRFLHHRHLTFKDYVLIDNRDGCPLWRSIDLDFQNQLVISDNVAIESSLYGIRTMNDASAVSLSDTYFFNNWISMVITRPLSLTRFDRNLFYCTEPLDPLGTCELTLPEPVPFLQQQSFAGIVTNEVTLNIPIPAQSLPPGTGWNLFRGLANGIWMRNTHAQIRRCKFDNLTNNVYGGLGGNGIRFRDVLGSHSLRQWGLGLNTTVWPVTFEDCVTGIRVISDNAFNTLVQSRDNVMQDVANGYDFNADAGNLAANSFVVNNNISCFRRGVWAKVSAPDGQVSHLRIANNHIAHNGTSSIGIHLENTFTTFLTQPQDFNVIENEIDFIEGRAGIETRNFRGAHISGNTVDITDVTVENEYPFPPIGIYLNGGRQNTVNCTNKVTGTWTTLGGTQHGMVTDMSQDNDISDNVVKFTRLGIEFRNHCGTNTLFSCNSMEGHSFGLRYWPTAVTGPQGPSQTSRGNMWLGTWPTYPGSVGAVHLGTLPFIVENSLFNAQSGTNQWPPSIEVGVATMPEWFTNNNAYVNCQPSCDQLAISADVNSADSTVAKTGYSLSVNEEAYNWGARRYLYEKLAENPGLGQSDSLMQAFRSEHDATSIGLLHTTALRTKNLFVLDTVTLQLLEDNFNAIQNALSEIIAIDSILAADTVWSESDSLLLLSRQTWEDSIAAVSLVNEYIREVWLDNRAMEADSVIAFNSTISTDSTYDENEKVLHDIYLKTVVKAAPPTLVQKALIRSIAEQCPEAGSYATYWARAWYSSLTGVLVEPQGCEGVQERSYREMPEAGTQLSDTWLKLTPNPAQNHLKVAYHLPFDWEIARLRVLNAAGLLVASFEIDPDSQFFSISLEGMPNGIYFLHILSGGKKTPVQKLIILK